MDKIKSAWEIALEKTKDIEADRAALKEQEYLILGKKIISQFLDNPDRINIVKQLMKIEKKAQPKVKQGVLKTLLNNLHLSNNDSIIERNNRVKQAFLTLLPSSNKINFILEQIELFFKKYREDRSSIEENLREQYKPKLRQKEEAISKQLGSEIKLDPAADPEFATLLKKNFSLLEERYDSLLKQVKDELKQESLKYL